MAIPTLSIVKGTGNTSLEHNSRQISKTIDNLNADKQLLLELSNKLHSTLDLKNLITLFKLEITPVLNLDEIIYHEPDNNSDIEPKGRHMLSYQLVLHKKALGEIALIRRTRFTSKEQHFVEKILVSLLSPLNNALEYHNALHAALHDQLTGVFNRFAMDNIFSREMGLAHRNYSPLSIIALDIDFFKQVNDNYGHASGDCVLKHLTYCVSQCIRNTDVIFRYGGEEFTILLNNTDLEGALQLAERIRKTVEQTPCLCNDGKEISITVSLGISTLNSQDSQDSLFERADKALYQAKKSGRNRVICEQTTH